MLSKDRPNILLVDRDESSLNLFRDHFERRGWKVSTTMLGKEAVDLTAYDSFDIILTDTSIDPLGNDLGCFDIINQIKLKHPNQVFMVVTSSFTTEEVAAALKVGAQDCLKKPIDLDSVGASMEKIVKSIRQDNFEINAAKAVVREQTEYEFISKDIADGSSSLPIFSLLESSGKITLNAKLQLILAFQEAVTNSLEHGNLELASSLKDEFDDQGLDLFSIMKRKRLNESTYADRKIFIKTLYDGENLSITIKDEGKGFTVPEQRKLQYPDQLMMHGRGMTIIGAVMDKVSYSEGGTRITLEKKL